MIESKIFTLRMTWRNVYLLTFFTALAFALVLTPLCRRLAIFLNVMDHPAVQDHKRHVKATPLLGGLAICLSWLITIGIGLALSRSYLVGKHFDLSVTSGLGGISAVSKELIVICLGALAITLFGIIDDIHNMSAKSKFAGQLAVAMLAVTWGGARISIFISYPFLSWAISVFWILTLMNAMNFFDNMDGLAIGVAAIAFSFFTITAAIQSQYFVAVFGAAMAGAAVGFWFFNHTPAALFMGDSGSHLIGYNLAVLGCLVTFYKPELAQTKFSVLIPLFILAIPLYDLCAVMLIRWRLGKPLYIGDHNHLSHRFVQMGLSRKDAVFVIHLMALATGLSVLPLLWGDMMTVVVCLIQGCVIVGIVSVLQYAVIKNKNKEESKDVKEGAK